MPKQVAVLIGSDSQTSFNHLAVKYLQKIAPSSIKLNVVDIADLPLYNRDLDTQDVPAYTRVRKAIKTADAIIWVTPEHNSSYSVLLRNAIDVVSRPVGQSLWIGKPLGLVSINASGTTRAVDALRTLAGGPYISMPVAPVAGIVGGIFAGAFRQGELISEQGQKNLKTFIDAYADFIARF